MSKTWYGHHIETIKGYDYVLHKDYTEIQDKLYKCEKVLDKIKEFIKEEKEEYEKGKLLYKEFGKELEQYTKGQLVAYEHIEKLLEEIE